LYDEYLRDSYDFAMDAISNKNWNEKLKQRYFRVSIFCGMAAIEAFVNNIADILSYTKMMCENEKAFLLDKKMILENDKFIISEQNEFHKIEDKIKFLLSKYVKDFDFGCNRCWSDFISLKRKRDFLIHSRSEEDDTKIIDYESIVKNGITSINKIMDYLCLGIKNKKLRTQIRDLRF